MNICIYQGANEIGGNCIEISTQNTRILLDIGLPLISMESDAPIDSYRLPISGLYSDQMPTIDGIFISHGHPDHYGLLPLVNSEIPVYLPTAVRKTLTEIQPVLPGEFDISHLNIFDILPHQKIVVGDLTITAHSVDHAPDAMAYEITDGKQRVVYTGDIRFHSSQAYKSFALARNAKNPDYLIVEGTRLSRINDIDNENYPTEESVRDGIVRLIQDSGKLAYISMSSQNLDRLCSLISATRRTGRTLVLDAYTAAMLDIYHSVFPSVPTVDALPHVKIYYGTTARMAEAMCKRGLFFKHKSKKITATEILENPSKYVIKYNPRLAKYLAQNGVDDYDFIYSMWAGYIERQNTWDMHMDKLVHIHTSGHASCEALKNFVEQINPGCIIPIHTECKHRFESIFGRPVLIFDNNETKEI